MKLKSRTLRMIAILTVGVFSMVNLSGCAAGNYGLLRTVANWNLRMSPFPRVVVYVAFLVIPVYELTGVFDLLINNSVEFWSGSPVISAKNDTFQKNGYRVEVANSRTPLRKTVVTVYDKSGHVKSVSELRETPRHTIQVYVNGVKKSELSDSSVQVADFAQK